MTTLIVTSVLSDGGSRRLNASRCLWLHSRITAGWSPLDAVSSRPGASDGSVQTAGWQFTLRQHAHYVCMLLWATAHGLASVSIGGCALAYMSAFKDTVWVFTAKGWKRKAYEESNHLLTARHDWKYAKYNSRNRDGYSPLACGMGETLPSILNRKETDFYEQN